MGDMGVLPKPRPTKLQHKIEYIPLVMLCDVPIEIYAILYEYSTSSQKKVVSFYLSI